MDTPRAYKIDRNEEAKLRSKRITEIGFYIISGSRRNQKVTCHCIIGVFREYDVEINPSLRGGTTNVHAFKRELLIVSIASPKYLGSQ